MDVRPGAGLSYRRARHHAAAGADLQCRQCQGHQRHIHRRRHAGPARQFLWVFFPGCAVPVHGTGLCFQVFIFCAQMDCMCLSIVSVCPLPRPGKFSQTEMLPLLQKGAQAGLQMQGMSGRGSTCEHQALGQTDLQIMKVFARLGTFNAITIPNLPPSTTYYYKCAPHLCV